MIHRAGNRPRRPTRNFRTRRKWKTLINEVPFDHVVVYHQKSLFMMCGYLGGSHSKLGIAQFTTTKVFYKLRSKQAFQNGRKCTNCWEIVRDWEIEGISHPFANMSIVSAFPWSGQLTLNFCLLKLLEMLQLLRNPEDSFSSISKYPKDFGGHGSFVFQMGRSLSWGGLLTPFQIWNSVRWSVFIEGFDLFAGQLWIAKKSLQKRIAHTAMVPSMKWSLILLVFFPLVLPKKGPKGDRILKDAQYGISSPFLRHTP